MKPIRCREILNSPGGEMGEIKFAEKPNYERHGLKAVMS